MRVLPSLALASALAVPRTAAALQCFTVTAAPSALAGAARGTTLPVTFATAFRTVAGCDYGLAPDPAALGPVPPGETDFAALAAALLDARPRHGPHHGQGPDRPRTIYARVRGRDAVESVFRETCSDGFLADRAHLDAHVDTRTGALVIARRAAPASAEPAGDCGAAATVLRFVPVAAGAAPPALSREPAARVLAPGDAAVDLGAEGEFAVYAARTPTAPGFLVGRLRRRDPLTALRRRLAAPPSPEAPWFRPAWSPDGALRLARGPATAAAPDARDLWAELVTAAASDQLWLAEAPPPARGGAAPAVHGPLRVSADGDAVVLPDALVRAHLATRFGPASAHMVPTLDEWNELRDRLQLCLVDRYGAARAPGHDGGPAAVPAVVPGAARCARFASVVAPFILPDAVTPGDRSYCLQRRVRRLTARGPRDDGGADARLPEACAPMPTAGLAAPDAQLAFATVGDRIELRGMPDDGLYLCVDNRCEHLGNEAWQGGQAIPRAGLAEVRRAASADAALAAQGVTLARFGVLDPAAGWHPVGLFTGADGDAPANRWTTLAHDEDDVFAYVRRRHALAFRLATSAPAAAAWNRPGATAVLTQHTPTAGGVRGATGAPPASALVVLVTRDVPCPTRPASAVDAEAPVDPDALLVDQRFRVYLAQYTGDAEPYRCLARADFRVRESRALAPLPWLRLGLLGDLQAAVFLADPAALGVALPVGYAYARLPFGFGVDASLALTAAATFDLGAVSRAGAGLSVAAAWGPSAAPRLLSFGVVLHVATGEDPDAEPVASPYAALNVSTLVDLAGGR